MSAEPLFPSWSTPVLRIAVAAVPLTLLGVPALLMAWMRAPIATAEDLPVEQPLMFDHRHHVRDDGIPCVYCHTEARRSPEAGLPSTELCMGCHAQIHNAAPLTEPLRRSLATGRPLRWTRVHDLPDFAFFSHRAHTTRGVRCEDCHGDVSQMAWVRPVNPLNMGWCLACHRDPVAELGAARVRAWELAPPTHCSACHR